MYYQKEVNENLSNFVKKWLNPPPPPLMFVTSFMNDPLPQTIVYVYPAFDAIPDFWGKIPYTIFWGAVLFRAFFNFHKRKIILFNERMRPPLPKMCDFHFWSWSNFRPNSLADCSCVIISLPTLVDIGISVFDFRLFNIT